MMNTIYQIYSTFRNVNQEKTDSSNKELTETYTRENEK